MTRGKIEQTVSTVQSTLTEYSGIIFVRNIIRYLRAWFISVNNCEQQSSKAQHLPILSFPSLLFGIYSAHDAEMTVGCWCAHCRYSDVMNSQTNTPEYIPRGCIREPHLHPR